jgi:hypothetical protein
LNAIAALPRDDVADGGVARPVVRSTRDLLNTLAAITVSKADFRSLGDAWARIGAAPVPRPERRALSRHGRTVTGDGKHHPMIGIHAPDAAPRHDG